MQLDRELTCNILWLVQNLLKVIHLLWKKEEQQLGKVSCFKAFWWKVSCIFQRSDKLVRTAKNVYLGEVNWLELMIFNCILSHSISVRKYFLQVSDALTTIRGEVWSTLYFISLTANGWALFYSFVHSIKATFDQNVM